MADIKSLIDKFNIFRTKDSILNDVAKDNGQITIDIQQPFSDDLDSNNSLKTKLETNIKDKLFNTEINNVGSNIFDEKIKPFDKGYNVSNTPVTDTKTPIDTTPIKPDTPTIEKNTADATAIQQEKTQQPKITTPKPKQPQQYKPITEQQNTKLTTDSLGNPMPIDYDKRKGTSYSGVGQQQIDEIFNRLDTPEKFDMFMQSVYEAYDQLKSTNLNDKENLIFLPYSYDHENGNMNGIRLTFSGDKKEWAEKQLKILETAINDKQNEEWLSNLELPQPETTMDKITSNPWGKLLSFMQPPTDGMDTESKRILESGQKENRLNAIKWGLIENINECKDILAKYYKDKSQVGTALSQKNIAETINNVIFPQIDLVKQSEIASIISKYKKNPDSLTPIENEIVKYYSDYVNALSVVANKTSTGYETVKAIETSLPFMADFLRFNLIGSATRGGTRAAMKLGGKGLAKQIAKDTPKTIGARAFKLGEDILTAAGHTSVSPLTFTNMLEDYSQTIATNGQYTKNDLRRGVIEAFTENFSERMFGALKGILPKSNNAFVNSLFGNNPIIKSMQKHMNVGGMFEETAEEYAGAFVNTMFGFALGDKKLSSSFKEQLNNSVPTILSIGITVGLPQAIGMGIDFREIRNTNNRFNVAEDNLKQYFNKENSYLDINRYSDALKSLYINLNNAKNEEDKSEIKGKIAELNKTAANLAMEKGDSNGFNLISEYSIAAQNSFYVTNKAMSELKDMSEEDRTKLVDNAINKLKNDFTNNLNWSLISRAAAKNITDQNGKQHPTCFLYTDNGVTYVLNGQKDNMFYFVDVNGNTISKSADELRNNENLSVLHLNNLLSSFSNKELEDINSKFIDIAQYNAGYRYKVNDNGEIRYYTDNKDLINSNTPYERIDRDKIESDLVGLYDLVRIDNITNAVEDMANAFAEPAAEQTAAEQTSEQQPAQETAQETIEQPAEEQPQEQPQETAQEQPQEQTTEEQDTTEQEPIQHAQQEIKPTQEETIQEQTAQVSAFDRVKDIIIATAQRKEPDTKGFSHMLRSLSDEELNEALRLVNTKKGRSKIDKINIGALRTHIYHELEERDLSKNLEEAENRGYEYSLKSFENLPADFDYAGYIINQELQAENYEKSGYKGHAAFKRGLIRAVKKLQVQAAEAEDVNTNPTEAQKKGTDEKEDNVAQEPIKKKRQSNKETKEKEVNLQQQTGGYADDIFAETNNADTDLHRKFAMTVKADMLAALDNDTKPYRSILDLRKRARELGIEVDNDGRTDILLQELVEDGLVRAAREVIARNGRKSRTSYDLICKLYEMQPTIAARSSNRIKMQQYSTPLPMAWIANRFAMEGKGHGKVLEPTAGNGMLVFTVPVEQVHANELDETRLDNLREQGFAEVTQQDATEPFEGGMQYDVVIANPPFGKREAVEYDGKMIAGLDPQITLNALASMKDDGRAAIIIGGNMEYASNGSIKSMKPFFTYLYDHYNVKGIIDMSGGLYAKQGTTFPTRMILIEGRRSDEERAQTAVYPPVESKAIRKAESFDDLYDIINEVLNSKEKTNGTEVLRSRERQLVSVDNETFGNTDGAGHNRQSRKNDDVGSRREPTKENSEGSYLVLPREHRTNNADGERGGETQSDNAGGSRRVSDTAVQRVGTERVPADGVGLKQTPTEPKKRDLSEQKLPYRPHNSSLSLNSVAPAAMVEAMDNVLTQIEAQHGSIDEYVRTELGYDTIEEAHQALAAEQMDSVAMAIYQMKQGQALIIGDQTGVGKGRQMAALIRWAVKQGEKPIFITQKADLFSDIYRDLVDVGSGDLVPFIFNSDGAMVDSKGNTVHKPLSDAAMKKVMASGTLPDEYDFVVLTYTQVNSGDAISQQEMEEAAKKRGIRTKKSKNVKNGKSTLKPTFLRAIAEDNYLFLDESHSAAGQSNTGAYLQSIIRTAKAATFASATFAKRPDTMPLYAIRTAMSKAKVEPDKMISIIEKGGVTLQEIMSRELTNAGQMVRRERDMSDVITDWKTITDPETVRRARENYDRTIAAFNAIIKFQEEYVKPMIEALDTDLAIMAESADIKRGTDKMGVENTPFASKTYNYTKQLMLALKVDAIVDEVEAEINAGRHPVIALESTMESSIKDNYAVGDIIDEPTFSASLLKGLDTVMQYTITDENGNKINKRYSPQELGPAGEKAYYELQDFIRESTRDIFISPLDAIIERLHEKGYKVGELTGRNLYVERDDDGSVVVKRRTDKDKKRMQREFNSGILDVLILNKSASTGISLHASEKFSDQRQRSMIIAQPLSDINDYMQMIGRIDRTGQVHRGYYINLGLPVPAENRFLMMLSTKLKSLNANTTTSQDSESNDVEAPDLLNKYGSQVVVEYLRDNVEIYEKMGTPLKKGVQGGGNVQASELDEYKPQEDDARKITGYVALLTTKEQEEFYDDVVRRYNELIKYLNDTGSNDLKISVMPLRAKTIDRRVSSEGIDPNGSNPFARNSYVEKVEMDVLRKPMKADEIRKVIEQINRGIAPAEYLESVINTISKEDEARIAREEERYEKAKAKAADDITKQTNKINKQQKRSEEEKRDAIENFIEETNKKVEEKHDKNILRINQNNYQIMQYLRMFEVGKSYLVPDNLNSMTFDFATPAIFCGYKTKDSKITASTTLAVFATLDARRRIEIKLSDIDALRSIDKMTNDNWDAARSTTLDNWDSQIPNEKRKIGFIMTGNILQAIADTQDEYGGYPGQLISYTDIDGNVHDGILMPDKWDASMLKTSGVPLSSRLQQIKDYKSIISHDGKVEITGSSWAKMFYLTVPKTKKDGAVYFENKTLLDAAGGNFYPYRGKLRADIPADRIDEVVQELTKLGVKVKEERNDDILYQKSDGTIDVLSTEEAALRDALIDKLREAGIDVITDVEEAQRLLDEANGKGVSYFRTADGDAYGLKVGGKIYIDPRIATADTPIHEYAHLWASAMQKLNPNEWENIVKLMKGTPIWEEVKRNYPELTTDNEIADEVLAFYSGSRGAERLREEHAKILKGNGNVVEKVKAINAIKRVREALKRFWKNVAEWFGIHFTTAEEVADKVLSDLLNGVNPTLAGIDNDIRYRRASNRSVISSRFERQAEIQREEKNTKSAANIVLGNANVVLNDTNIFDEQYQNAIDNNLIDENVSPLIDSFGITWGYQLKNGVIVINKDVFVSDILDKRVKDNLSLLISSLMKTNKTFFKEGISFFKKLPIWVLYKNDTKSNEDTIKEIINDILLGNTSIDTNKLELLKQYTVQDMNDILDNATKWFEKFEGISSNMFAGNSISDILDTTLGDLMPKEITTTQEGKRLNWFSKLGIDIRSKLFDSLDWFRVVSDKTKDKTASELYDAMIVHTKRVQGKINIFDKEYVRPIIDTIQSMLGKDFGNSTLSLDLIQEYFAIKSLLGRTASLYKERFGEYLANPDGKKPPMFDEFKQIYDEITEDEIRQRINEMGEKSSMSILQKVDIDYLMEDVRRTLAAEMFVKQYVYSSANTLNQGLQGEQSLGLINEVTNEPYSELYQLLYSDEQSSQTMHSPIEIIEQADILIDRAGLREEFDFIGNQIQAILNYVNINRFENGLMSSDTFAKRQLMKDFVNQRGENSSEGNLYEITAKQKANEKMKGKDWFNPNSITSIIAVAQTEIATMEKELLAQRLSYFLTNPNNFDVLSQYGMIIDEKETLNEELSEDDRNYIMDKNIVLLYGDRHTDKNTKGQVDKKQIKILKRNDDGTFTKVTISFDNKFIGLEEFVKFVNNNFKYEELRGISKAVAPLNAWLSRIYTILSPVFSTKNFFRDLMVTPWLPAKELNGKNSQYVIKNFYNAFNNLSFILKMSFTEKSFSKKGFENKLKARSQELFEYYLEYSKQHSIFSIEDQIGALSKENKTLQDIERALSGKENKFIKFTEQVLLIKFMQHYAEVFENLHKFSAYVTLRKLGYGEERSAQIANNATLNYDRSGSIGRQLNAIIPFAKAALGGFYRTKYLLPKYNPKGFLQRVITLAVLGVMQGLMYDPDDDDISEFARKSGMVFGSFLYPLLPEELAIVRPVRALVIVMTGKKSPAYFKQELMESTIDLVPVASDALRGAFSYNPLTNKTEFDVGQLFANTDKMTAFYALAMLASYINENKNSFGKNVLLNEETNTDKTRYGRTKQDYGLYDYIARLYNSIINGVDIDDRAAMSNKIGKNGERLMTIAKEDVEFVINNYIPFGRLYAYTAEIIYDAVNDKRINKGHIPLIGGLFAQKSFGKDYYLVNNIKYELKDFTNDFSQSQIEDIKTNILDKAGIREGIRYKALKDNPNANPRMLDKAKRNMNEAFNVFILDINNVDKKDFTEDEQKLMLYSFLNSSIMKKALSIGEDTLNKHTAKRIKSKYDRYKKYNNENIDTDKEDMNEAAKNFKKMLYDKSITEEEFNNKLNSLWEPMFQQIKLRAKFAGYSIE